VLYSALQRLCSCGWTVPFVQFAPCHALDFRFVPSSSHLDMAKWAARPDEARFVLGLDPKTGPSHLRPQALFSVRAWPAADLIGLKNGLSGLLRTIECQKTGLSGLEVNGPYRASSLCLVSCSNPTHLFVPRLSRPTQNRIVSSLDRT
jgi:hypothetical protein